jgi:hypothetical protein
MIDKVAEHILKRALVDGRNETPRERKSEATELFMLPKLALSP